MIVIHFCISEISKAHLAGFGESVMGRINEWKEFLVTEIVMGGAKAQTLQKLHNDLTK